MPMQVAVAQLPGPASDDDRVVVTDDAVIVLDGASGCGGGSVQPGMFAERLGQQLAVQIARAPEADLTLCLELAIEEARSEMELQDADGPSTTVSVFRALPGRVDVLVLGDSPIAVGGARSWEVVTDSRLENLDLQETRRYRERLLAGHGYGPDHERLVVALRERQRRYRNRPGGFWVAAANPVAARYARVMTFAAADVRWTVMATDGAARPLVHLGWDDWSRIARLDTRELEALLQHCHRWETESDPDGVLLPRAKCHDDKTLVAIDLTEPHQC
ncbi:MAG: hypothetical protein ACYDBS_05195 [Acidimicrobiales bacterium]